MVTAEAAVVLPLLVLMTLLALTAVAVGAARVRCLEAAGLAARLSARGDAPAVVESAVRAAAPRGVRVRLMRADGLIHAQVVLPVHVALLGVAVPALTVSEDAYAVAEPGTGGAAP